MLVDDRTMLRLDLDGFELDELRSYMDESLFRVDSAKPDEAYGEPITIAVIILAPIAINALAAWMTKNRNRGELALDSEITYPDGKRERKRLLIRRNSSTTEPEVLNQLKELLKLDPKLVQAAASLGT